jgi:hypothetical protein
MLYSILIYDSEAVVNSWSREDDDAIIAGHVALQEELRGSGKLGPVVRLAGTDSAVTYRLAAEPIVTDGPYTETKEALLGLYVVDCASREEAVEIARKMPQGTGLARFEVRPVRWYEPGSGLKAMR